MPARGWLRFILNKEAAPVDDEDDFDELDDDDAEIDVAAARELVRRHGREYTLIQEQQEVQRLTNLLADRDRKITNLERELAKERAMPYRGTNVEALLRTIQLLGGDRERAERDTRLPERGAVEVSPGVFMTPPES